MEKSSVKARSIESGNVLFFILLAVGLFAALTFAISSGDRGGGGIEKSRARVVANDIISFGGAISSAVEQIRQEGFSENDISFAHSELSGTYGTYDSTPPVEVFNPRGGGVTFAVPGGRYVTGDPIFSATNDVRNVGTRCADGTCSNCTSVGNPACADLIMFLPLNSLDVCEGINSILEVGEDTANMGTLSSSFNETLFAGTFSYQRPIESTGAENIYNGENAGCFLGSTGGQDGIYYYYHVLLAR